MLKRRHFLASAGLAAGGAAFGYPASDTLNVGCIGVGGRCRFLLKALVKIPGVRVAAICDIWDAQIEQAKPFAAAKPFVTRDYHELLARKEIDAVLIAAPDHWHAKMTVDACAAGKDVYVEKPLTHDLSEGEAVIRAQNEHRRIVQVGTQQRSMPHFQRAFEIVRSGRIGKIHKVHLTWNRNHKERMQRRDLGIDPKTVDWKRFLGSAPQQPYDEYRFRNWRWFWDFGGGALTDLMVHHIDIVNWYLGLGHPALAATIGDNFASKGLWETPDTVQTLIQYPEDQAQVYFEATFINARNAEMIEFMGTEATLYLDRGRYEIHPERTSRMEYSEWILGAGPRGADFYENPDGELLHLQNWLDCIRTRKKPNVPAEEGVRAVEGAHLGNQAYRTGQVAKWVG